MREASKWEWRTVWALAALLAALLAFVIAGKSLGGVGPGWRRYERAGVLVRYDAGTRAGELVEYGVRGGAAYARVHRFSCPDSDVSLSLVLLTGRRVRLRTERWLVPPWDSLPEEAERAEAE